MHRRDFIRGLISLGVSAAVAEELAFVQRLGRVFPGWRRPPFVRVGQLVDFIGLDTHPRPTFIGATIVREVGAWDGARYPCRVEGQDWRGALMDGVFADGDLANLHECVPHRFWAPEFRRERRYTNLAAYVREKRFGEDPLTYEARRWARRLTS